VRLRGLIADNFRSLQHVELHDLSDFNVLIGRNNVGKSAVLRIVEYLAARVTGRPVVDPPRILIDSDLTRPLGVQLVFDVGPDEREAFVRACSVDAPTLVERDERAGGKLGASVHFNLLSRLGTPHEIGFHRTRITAEDGEWGMLEEIPETDLTTGLTSLRHTYLNLQKLIRHAGGSPITSQLLQLPNPAGHAAAVEARDANLANFDGSGETPTSLPFRWLRSYLTKCFFFGPHRHATESLVAQEAN
jgi:hypothetical protein